MSFNKDYKNIAKHYRTLVKLTKKNLFVGITNEWIVDNYYVVVEQKTLINKFLKKRKKSKYMTKNMNMYNVMTDILVKHNYKIDEGILIDELNKFQNDNYYNFLYKELYIVPEILMMVFIKKISDICSIEENKINDKEFVNNLINQLKIDILNKGDIKLKKYIDINKISCTVVTYLNEQLKELNEESSNIFKQLNDLLRENNISFRELLNKEHIENTDNRILIGNIFNSIICVNDINMNNLYESVNDIEKLLKKDKYYHNMTYDTKKLYREQILKVAKKSKILPEILINQAIEKSETVSYFFFKNKDKRKLSTFYVTMVLVVSLILAILSSKFLIPNIIIGTIILFIPVTEIINYIVSTLINCFHKNKPIPKMDFSSGIPKDHKTMVVVPTILKDKEKVEQVFNNLELYYLANKSENIYFSLLGDVKEHDKEIYEKDDEIGLAGKEKVAELNKRYGKDIFFFAYRKRKFNPNEGTWLGYERKRGGLLHFNDLILGNLTKNERNDFFHTETFSDFKENIKYVITLDVDSKLVLHSGLKLVGAMAHPLNKPILNEEGNRVIYGYGIMQPKIATELNSTNKSLFSQIYAGIGGFDPYSDLCKNFYQDVFGEGSFIGKGIYDLEICQRILKEQLPDNLILSHDLLEGNYLKCGYVSDIEIIDEFPSKFLIDASRRSRWARGDTQILDWITPKVSNKKNELVKNPLSVIGKWKIFDNIRRELLPFFLVLIIFLSVIFNIVNPMSWICLVLLILLLPGLSSLIYQLRITDMTNIKLKYYNILASGFKSLVIRLVVSFATLPYDAYLYLNSIIRSLYRMLVSKKKLLNWMTAEDAEKFVKTTFDNTIKQFWPNYIVIFLLLIVMIVTKDNLYLICILTLLLLLAPFLAYITSKDIIISKEKLDKDDTKYIKDIAKKTWNFFADHLTSEMNYLIPDNIEFNRDNLIDYRSSPTNIGLSLTSVISANEIGITKDDEAIDLLKKILTTIEKLPKWNGHLYNWYNTLTLEVIFPSFVSSVDSGNFVACLIVVKEYLKEKKEFKLVTKLEKMITETDFSKFYAPGEVFSIGYNSINGKLEAACYRLLASESRICSYIAIAKGDVPSQHWYVLDKTLTVFKRKKGVVSWSGTSFEYFMPLLFMKSYPNTLIDEAYDFSAYAQRHFINEIDSKYPWGISESAYAELDDAQNYKYHAFATPYLRLREEPVNRFVITPYGLILALTRFPKDVVNNMHKYHDLDMLGKYGFYESYDITDQTPVYAYFSHHQGMILASLANQLKDGIIQEYFGRDTNNKAFDILLKEKVQLKPMINLKIMNYKKFSYNKEEFVNDVRVFHHLSTLPEVSVLSNSKYTTLVNDRGNGFSRYRTIQLNRYRKITEQDYGMFAYIKDLDTGDVWSNTYAPINFMPNHYEVIFALDKIKFLRTDNDIVTTTEIVVIKKHHGEIRKLTFKNIGDKPKHLELTTYTEATICDNPDDVSHRTFNNLFVKSEYDKKTNSLILQRHLRGYNSNYYFMNRLFIPGVSDGFEYETNRENFIGRNRFINDPIALNQKLSNFTGTTLDPIISLRNRIVIEPNSSKTVYLIVGFGKSREQINDIIDIYGDEEAINEKAFEVATIMSNVTSKMVNITARDMRLYNIMLNYLYQTNHISINEDRAKLLAKNTLSQSNLWRYGISGDRPIILLSVSDIKQLSIVKELLHAFEYYKSRSIFVDLVIINSEKKNDSKILAKEIEAEKHHMYAINSFNRIPGNIYVIERENINAEELILLNIVSRLNVDTKKYNSLQEYINELQKLNTISRRDEVINQHSLPVSYDEKSVSFFNGFGGFTDNGKSYLIINKNTPTVWSNMIVNKKFGSIVTNNKAGFTYAINSREFKITSWTNDTVVPDISEGIKFNDINLNFDQTKFGFGYSEFKGKLKDYDISLTEFVATDDPVKFYKLKIKNNNSHKQRISLKYWINPCLGVAEEKTSRHILSNFNEKENYLNLRNVYNEVFNDQNIFMSATNKIENTITNRILSKQIETSIYIDGKAEEEMSFILGCCDEKNISKLLSKYSDVKNINREQQLVMKAWTDQLSRIQVRTPEQSFDYMVNGWLLYQTLSSRLYAKAGFHQVGGAYGYRDQLQDSMNICFVNPELTKKQILFNAKHQFKEGDVLHWWHEELKFGLRSLYKDDYLWLIYATNEYVKITGDLSILDEEIFFVTGDSLNHGEDEKGIQFDYSKETSTLYQHCQIALEKSMNELGSNGLPLMGGGDWNDGMNKIGIRGKGTSVWLGFFLYMMVDKFVEMTKLYNSKTSVKKYEDFNKTLKLSLQNNAWDGEYYKRAFFDNGYPVGSHKSEECQIDLISQSFSILSGVAKKDQIKSIIDSVEDKLVDRELKILKLITPGFDKNKYYPGYIMDYPVGIRENGGQYTHGSSWYLEALIKLGMNDKAFEYYQMINPINRTLTKEEALKYKGEPYVIAGDIYSSNDHKARAGWTWYTGSSGWFYRIAIINILGFNKEGNKLYIKPNVPSDWNEFEITYKYEATTYNIKVIKNSSKGITLDNSKLKTDYIELVNDKKVHEVSVNI